MESEVQRQVRSVRDYYDQHGWRSLDDGRLVDLVLFADINEVSRAYRARERARDRDLLPPRGQRFLDAASGALPYADYSDGFDSHVCVDISVAGLREARRRGSLGDRGHYVNADLRRLPFVSGCFGAVLSAHTLYHLPAAGQSGAVGELVRLLGDGAAALVLYTNVDSLTYRLKRAWEQITRRSVVPRRPLQVPPLFSQPVRRNDLEALIVGARGVPVFRCHSLMSRQMLQWLVPNSFLGRWIVGAAYRLETSLPRFALSLGQYFSIQIRSSQTVPEVPRA